MKNIKSKTVIILINNLEKEDYLSILNDNQFKENLLVLFDKNTINDYKFCPIDYLVQDFNNVEKVISDVKAWKESKNKDIVGIVGLDEEYKYFLSKELSNYFGLKFYDKNTIKIVTNKYLQKVEFKKNKINVPNFKLLNDDNADGINFPNVLKPVFGIGSFFVFLNKNEAEFKNNFGKLKKVFPQKKIILEEFIGGDEYSCDFIVNASAKVKILRVVKKITDPEDFPFFEGFYLFNPDNTRNSDFKIAELEDLCKKVADSIGVNSGICMMDFKFFNKKLFVIETTVRPGISQFIELMKQVYGYISIDFLLKQILKIDFAIKIPNKNALIFYVTTKKSGVIKQFDTSYIEKNSLNLGIINISKYVAIGQKAQREENKDYSKIILGSVSIKNIEMDNIENVIKHIKNHIYIEIESKETSKKAKKIMFIP